MATAQRHRQATHCCVQASEAFLQRMMSLYVASHYRNTPNDLILMSDAPAHHLFALLGPVEEGQVMYCTAPHAGVTFADGQGVAVAPGRCVFSHSLTAVQLVLCSVPAAAPRACNLSRAVSALLATALLPAATARPDSPCVTVPDSCQAVPSEGSGAVCCRVHCQTSSAWLRWPWREQSPRRLP